MVNGHTHTQENGNGDRRSRQIVTNFQMTLIWSMLVAFVGFLGYRFLSGIDATDEKARLEREAIQSSVSQMTVRLSRIELLEDEDRRRLIRLERMVEELLDRSRNGH